MHTPDTEQQPRQRGRTRRRLMLITAGLVVAATAGVVPLALSLEAGATTGDAQARLQQGVNAIHDTGAVGVQARIVTPEGEHVAATAGVGNRETGAPVPSDGFFRMGSNTKTFTATVVLQLVGEGKLSLEDSVEQYLPGVVPGGAGITVRQLLNHTSGLPDYDGAILGDGGLESLTVEKLRTLFDRPAEELVALALEQEPSFAPGEGWAYSNTNYLLAGMLIEQVTGNPWNQEVEQRIITPLGLDHTSWPGDSPELPDPHARAYMRLKPDGPLEDVTEVIQPHADGALLTTTADLNDFFRALMRGELLPPELQDELLDTIPTNDELFGSVGLGLYEVPLSCGGTYFTHGGTSFGSLADLGVTADGQRSVAVSTTSQQATEKKALQRHEATQALIDDALCDTD